MLSLCTCVLSLSCYIVVPLVSPPLQGLHGAGGGRQNWYGQGQGLSEGEGVTGGGA